MIKYLTYFIDPLTYPRVIKAFGLCITFISIATAMEASTSDVLEEKDNGAKNRITVTIPPLSFSGDDISTVFWGPYQHMDEIQIGEDIDISDLAPRVEQWAKKTCHEEKITKISIDVPNDSSIIETLLNSAGFSAKALIYCLDKEKALNLLQEKEIFTENMYTISCDTSPFLPSAKTLYGKFNKAMRVPGLFYACAADLLEKGGKICVHQNPQTLTVDGFISYGFFQNKFGNKSILIDSLFVDPNSRGQGISYMLIKYALTVAFEEGATMIHWETGMGRSDAQNFYQKLSIVPYGVAYRYRPSKKEFLGHFGGNIFYHMLPRLPSW